MKIKVTIPMYKMKDKAIVQIPEQLEINNNANFAFSSFATLIDADGNTIIVKTADLKRAIQACFET